MQDTGRQSEVCIQRPMLWHDLKLTGRSREAKNQGSPVMVGPVRIRHCQDLIRISMLTEGICLFRGGRIKVWTQRAEFVDERYMQPGHHSFTIYAQVAKGIAAVTNLRTLPCFRVCP